MTKKRYVFFFRSTNKFTFITFPCAWTTDDTFAFFFRPGLSGPEDDAWFVGTEPVSIQTSTPVTFVAVGFGARSAADQGGAFFRFVLGNAVGRTPYLIVKVSAGRLWFVRFFHFKNSGPNLLLVWFQRVGPIAIFGLFIIRFTACTLQADQNNKKPHHHFCGRAVGLM